MTDTALARYEKRAELPLVGGAVVFLVVYAWPILDPGLDPAVRRACQIVNVIVWIGFAADYLIRLRLSVNRRRYVRVYWFDLVILALPMFRPLRALRAVLALSILNRSATPLSRGRVVAFVSLAVVIVMGVAGLAMLDAERHAAGSRITSYGDALWWAVSTVTTVGYGDKTPVTTQGRLIAVALMVTGIALLGVVTAALASWFVEHFREVEAASVRRPASLSSRPRWPRSATSCDGPSLQQPATRPTAQTTDRRPAAVLGTFGAGPRSRAGRGWSRGGLSCPVGRSPQRPCWR